MSLLIYHNNDFRATVKPEPGKLSLFYLYFERY